MNTIHNQRVLRSRMSAGWTHDSAHFSFPRTSPADQCRLPFVEDARNRAPDWPEALIWAAAFAALMVFLFVALGIGS